MKNKLSLMLSILVFITSIGVLYLIIKNPIRFNPLTVERNQYEIVLDCISRELADKDKPNEEEGTLITLYFCRNGAFFYKLDTIAPPQNWKLCILNQKDSLIIIGEWDEAPSIWNNYYKDK